MAAFKLSVMERLMLLRVLPQQGDFTTLRIVRRIREALSFSEREHQQFGIVAVGDTCRWRDSVDRSIEFGVKAREIVHAAIKAQHDAKTLTGDMLSLVEKFAPELCPDDDAEESVTAGEEATVIPQALSGRGPLTATMQELREAGERMRAEDEAKERAGTNGQ